MPEPLHWFKWEAYTTWLSGFALMVVLYYFDAELRLVDRDAADLDEWQAITLSLAGIALAWVVYDVLCRTVGRRSQEALAVVGTGLVALAAWAASELFAPRAAYLQVGVMLGTIMVANVLLVIIPAHRKLVATMEAKHEPDPAPLLEAKDRSVHNNYLTLPVLFTMLAGHFAFVFSADQAWLVFVAIAVLTALDPRLLQPLARRDAARGGSPRSPRLASSRSRSGSSRTRPVAAPPARSRSSKSSPCSRSAARLATRAPLRRSASASRRGSRSMRAPTTSGGRRWRRARCRRGTSPGSPRRSGSCSVPGRPRDSPRGPE